MLPRSLVCCFLSLSAGVCVFTMCDQSAQTAALKNLDLCVLVRMLLSLQQFCVAYLSVYSVCHASFLMFPRSWVIFQPIMWLYGLFFFVLYELPSKLKLFGESGECFRCPWCIFRNALGRLLSCRKKNGWVFSETASL